MNYFTSLTKALGGPHSNLLFSIGPAIGENYYWTLSSGVKKDDQQPVTVFIFDIKKHPDKLPLARNALKRAKTIRYPDCVKFIDGMETEYQIIIGTEQVEPLQATLFQKLDYNLVRLGIYKLASTIRFLSEDCQMIHGFISVNSVFVTRSGEWKLGGFDVLSNATNDQPLLQRYGHLLPPTKYIAPELDGGSRTPTFSADCWAFGSLIYSVYNGSQSGTIQFDTRGNIPTQLFRHLKNLVSSNASTRLDISKFLKITTASSGFFDDPFVSTSMFLEQLALKDKTEKEQFLVDIEKSVGSFPVPFCKYKILPELLQSLEFGSAGAKALKPILTIGGRLEAKEFSELVTPAIVKLFKSSDRSIRLALCEKIDVYVGNLSDQVSGFLDGTAIIREQTLKAVTVIAPKLQPKTINNSLLRHLAKLQVDPEPGIRTNTTICLAKLSQYFDDSVKSKVLLQAFARSLHDPFPFARKAGLMGISATSQHFSADDIAKKILPHISPVLVDPEKSIRVQAFTTFETLAAILKKASDEMPGELQPADPASLSPSADASKGPGWASWALSAVSTGVTATASKLVETRSSVSSTSSHTESTTKPPERPVLQPIQAKPVNASRAVAAGSSPDAAAKPDPNSGWNVSWDDSPKSATLSQGSKNNWDNNGWGNAGDAWEDHTADAWDSAGDGWGFGNQDTSNENRQQKRY
ncbi:hypothetical protein HDV03_001100 [Kappamyces sp. JEL0829]|nr:hypothetical protein HDV03_001100 [Kappamyces sp. JEL0829]